MKHLIFTLTFIPLIFMSGRALADVYQIYFTDQAEITGGGEYVDYVKIINTSSYTSYDGNISGYYNQDFTRLENAASDANSGESFGAAMVHDQSSAPISVLDFTGTNIKFRANRAVNVDPVGVSLSEGYWYDVVNTVDLSDGSVQETILIASSQAEYDLAKDAGYTVILDSSEIDRATNGISFTSFSTNITNKTELSDDANADTKGGLVVEQISGIDGASIFRQEDDGTVHIGENSIVLADESVSDSGYDQIYSSSGVLELGNSINHQTSIRGSLSVTNGLNMNGSRISNVANPVASSDAATKGYVDSALNQNNSYADGSAASVAAMAAIPRMTEKGLIIGLGTGYQAGQSAIAMGVSGYQPEKGISFTLTTAYNSVVGTATSSAGIGFQFK